MSIKLSHFNRANVRELADAIERALQTVSEQYGVKIQRGNGRFDTAEFKLSITAHIINDSGTPVLSPTSTAIAKMVGFPAEFFGRTFTKGGTEYTVRDFNPKSKLYPVVCERSDGVRFKFTVAHVKALMVN